MSAALPLRPPEAAGGSSAPALKAHQRVFLWTLQLTSDATQGYAPAFFGQLVQAYGVRRSLRWMSAIDRTVQVLSLAFGEEVAHTLIALAALWNGCAYCAHGHLLAANLLSFERTGTLPPLDERRVAELLQRDDDALLAALRSVWGEAGAGLEQQRLWLLVERQFALKMGLVDGERPWDEHLRACLAAWDWVNECSLQVEGPGELPLAPVAKDRRLLQRYRRAREEERRRT